MSRRSFSRTTAARIAAEAVALILMFANGGSGQEARQVDEKLFNEVRQAIEIAKAEDVPFFYPAQYEEASKLCSEGLELYSQGKKGAELLKRFESALHQLKTATDNTRIAKIVLKPLLDQRREVIDNQVLESDKGEGRGGYFEGRLLNENDFKDEQIYNQARKAEMMLEQATQLIEKGDLVNARAVANEAEREYKRIGGEESAARVTDETRASDETTRDRGVEEAVAELMRSTDAGRVDGTTAVVPRERMKRIDTTARIDPTSVSGTYRGGSGDVKRASDVAVIEVIRPKEEIWYKGKEYPIQWTFSGSTSAYPNVRIDLILGGKVVPVVASTANTGAYTWKIPASLDDACCYKMRVTADIADKIQGESSFEIRPLIKITSPSYDPDKPTLRGADIWSTGNKETVTWQAGDITKARLTISGYENPGHMILLQWIDPSASNKYDIDITPANPTGYYTVEMHTEDGTLIDRRVVYIEEGKLDGMWYVDLSTDSDQHRWTFEDGKIFVINPIYHEQGGTFKRNGDKISFVTLVDGWNQTSSIDGEIVEKKDRVYIKTSATGKIHSHFKMEGTFKDEDINGKQISSGTWKAMKYVKLDG